MVRPRGSVEAAVRRALLGWFRLHARPLPWRKTKSPYAVWVSEIMLQQTQVATVIPYYRRFLGAFPTAARLARAPFERVLEVWSGLGYYRRARYLHGAAQVLVRRFGGRFPRDYRQARSLPGVGDYSARAILSIAYNLPYTVVDGNVARVVARFRALRGQVRGLRFRRVVERELDRLLSRRHPAAFNQALMELGQTVCLPRGPRCPVCPLRGWCRAYRGGRPEAYPAPRHRRLTELHHLAALVLRRGENVALVRGLDENLLSDLWNFPAAFGRSRADSLRRLQEKLAGIVGAPISYGAPFAELRHSITYRSIHVYVYLARISGRIVRGALRWVPRSRLPRAAISQLTRKIAATLGKA